MGRRGSVEIEAEDRSSGKSGRPSSGRATRSAEGRKLSQQRALCLATMWSCPPQDVFDVLCARFCARNVVAMQLVGWAGWRAVLMRAHVWQRDSHASPEPRGSALCPHPAPRQPVQHAHLCSTPRCRPAPAPPVPPPQPPALPPPQVCKYWRDGVRRSIQCFSVRRPDVDLAQISRIFPNITDLNLSAVDGLTLAQLGSLLLEPQLGGCRLLR